MSLDDDLARSGRAIASTAAASGPPGARRLRARRRRARLLAGTALVLVACAGTAAVLQARDQGRTVIEPSDQTPSTRIEAGHGASRLITAEGSSLGSLPAVAPDGTGDPVVGQVAGELLDDPAVADRLAAAGVTGDREARAALLADAGLVIETTIRPQALDAARASVGAGTALVSIDPSTGEIVALAGPVGTAESEAGTLYLPFDMAAALAAGVGPAEQIPAPGRFTSSATSADGRPWVVSNIDQRDMGTVTLAEAVAQTAYTPWIALFDQGRLDPAAVVDVAEQLGVTRPPPNMVLPASLIGIDSVNAVDMAEAYATFATAGRRPDVHVVGRILAADGTVLYDAASRPAISGPALDPGIAVQVRNALEQEICCGSAADTALGGDVAQFGQIGRVPVGPAWFAGSTPDLTTVVWGGLSAQVWHSYMEQAAGAAGAGFPG
ncbi:MAG TPA: hypothetical protein VH479_02190 [Acidimicrobiales bacterium]